MDDLLQRIERNLREYNAVRVDADYEKIAQDVLNPERLAEQWKQIWQASGEACQAERRILEIGSGFGGFVKYAAEQGIESVGIEIEAERVKISYDLLKRSMTKNALVLEGVGEHLPFPKASFDYVYSTNVLEHVTEPATVIGETIRILKPGGIFQMVAPNYGSWWEGHYGILWIPNLPKPLAKAYVRLYGRDANFMDTLQFINRKWLTRILSQHDMVEILGWGEGIWEERVRSLTFSTWGSLGRLKRMVDFLHRLKAIDMVIWLGKKLHWETPLILTVRKKA